MYLPCWEVYREECELELAQEAYGQAVQLEHDLIPAVFGLGWTYSSIGRDAEAADIFERLVKRGAGSLEVLYALTSLPPQLLSLDVLAEMDKLVGDPNQDMAAFVRAAALDKAGRHAEAWEQLVPANRALFVQMQDELNERRQSEQSSLARLRAASITIRGDGRRAGGHPISLFILGPSRSGKTSLERLVETLSAVKRGYENPIVEKSVRRAMQSASLLSSSIEHLPPQLDSQCRDIYLEELGRRAGSAQVFTNTHPATIYAVDRIPAVFPNVRFIFIKRNLEDILLRIYMRKFAQRNAYSYDLRSARDHVIWYYQMMDLLAEKLPNAVRIVSYEQMVADPAAVLRIAADLCELPMSVGSPLPAVGDDRGCALPYRELMADALSG
jgi:tetratricopeptide (TPR) repeat protein